MIFLLITVCNEVAKVMFLQACVCPQGGCLLSGGGLLLGGVSAPGGGVPGPGGVRSGGVPAPRRGTCSQGGCGGPLGETASAADGTHSTEMHSCFHKNITLKVDMFFFQPTQ